MLDDHAVQQGANSIETAHVQTWELGNIVKQSLHTKNIFQETFHNVKESTSFSELWNTVMGAAVEGFWILGPKWP